MKFSVLFKYAILLHCNSIIIIMKSSVLFKYAIFLYCNLDVRLVPNQSKKKTKISPASGDLKIIRNLFPCVYIDMEAGQFAQDNSTKKQKGIKPNLTYTNLT